MRCAVTCSGYYSYRPVQGHAVSERADSRPAGESGMLSIEVFHPIRISCFARHSSGRRWRTENRGSIPLQRFVALDDPFGLRGQRRDALFHLRIHRVVAVPLEVAPEEHLAEAGQLVDGQRPVEPLVFELVPGQLLPALDQFRVGSSSPPAP